MTTKPKPPLEHTIVGQVTCPICGRVVNVVHVQRGKKTWHTGHNERKRL